MGIDWTKVLERAVLGEQLIMRKQFELIERLAADRARLAAKCGEPVASIDQDLRELAEAYRQLPRAGTIKVGGG